MKVTFTFLICILFTPHLLANMETSAVFEQELVLNNKAHGQKYESTLIPELNAEISANTSMTLIGRLSFDGLSQLGSQEQDSASYNVISEGKHHEASIREWYLDTQVLDSYWRIGKQQVVWGQADGLKVLDVINPQDFREFILDDVEDSRIPLTMINVEIPVGDDNSLQLLWIADLTYNKFAQTGSNYAITSPLFVPHLPKDMTVTGFNEQEPSSVIEDSDFGIRYAVFYQGWDITFNYLYHYLDSPVLYQDIQQNTVIINSQYERNHLLGSTASKAFDDITLRAEVGYSTHSYHLIDYTKASNQDHNGIASSPDLSSVIGIDWQGLENILISVQWFQSHLFDDTQILHRPKTNHIVSFLYKQTFENETWALDILALHGTDKRDGSIQTKLSYALESNLSLWLGSDIFYGDKQGLFGQFREQDRYLVGFEWGF